MATQLAIIMESLATQYTQEDAESQKARFKTGDDIVNFLIYNTRQRSKAHGIKREDRAVQLHKLLYDQTYYDVFDDDDREYKTRFFFEHLIVIFNNDKKAMLLAIKHQLDRYFPIPAHLKREWNPVLVSIPYKPKRKRDTRTRRMSLRFDWSIKKIE